MENTKSSLSSMTRAKDGLLIESHIADNNVSQSSSHRNSDRKDDQVCLHVANASLSLINPFPAALTQFVDRPATKKILSSVKKEQPELENDSGMQGPEPLSWSQARLGGEGDDEMNVVKEEVSAAHPVSPAQPAPPTKRAPTAREVDKKRGNGWRKRGRRRKL